MPRWNVRPAEIRDALAIHANLRPADREEAVASAGPDVLRTLTASIEVSALCWTAELDGAPAFVIGCADNGDGTGCPWLVGTTALDAHPGALTKLTKRHIALMRERWPELRNYVYAKSERSVRWLARLGFEIHEPVPFGVLGRLFHPFTMGPV